MLCYGGGGTGIDSVIKSVNSLTSSSSYDFDYANNTIYLVQAMDSSMNTVTFRGNIKVSNSKEVKDILDDCFINKNYEKYLTTTDIITLQKITSAYEWPRSIQITFRLVEK